MGEVYLGEGVYANRNEEGVVLTTMSEQRICLDPEVLEKLLNYVADCGQVTVEELEALKRRVEIKNAREAGDIP